MEQDEAGTFERLKARRRELIEPENEKPHGRIFKLMGDGVYGFILIIKSRAGLFGASVFGSITLLRIGLLSAGSLLAVSIWLVTPLSRPASPPTLLSPLV